MISSEHSKSKYLPIFTFKREIVVVKYSANPGIFN